MAVILETTGGHIEVVERIANIFRTHYEYVTFIIPNHAMSAGTVLVMSGDEIFMDYFSVLGPIDPQIETTARKLVPALGYLIQYEGLIKTSKNRKLTDAELAVVLNFD